MKKIFAMLFLSLFLVSCFGNKEEIKKSTWSWTWVLVDEKKETWKVIYSWVEINVSEENLIKERSEITLEDIDLINFSKNENEKNNLLTAWKKFVENLEKAKQSDLTKNIDGWISFQNLENEIKKVPEILKKNVNLELEIFDFETKKIIENWIIFVNGVNLWEFKNGKFQKDFTWFKWIESFTVMVRVPSYWDWFIRLNSVNTDWTYLSEKIYLKKLNTEKKLKLDKEAIYEDKNLIVKIPECSLVDSEGNCYRWDVETKINFISAEDVNKKRISLNMVAITKEWKIEDLESGGMAFTEFITPAWEILQLWKNKTMEITYKVDEETIKSMENELWWQWQKNGYWLYDKNKNIWLEKEAEIKLDKENKTWTAIVSEIY